MKTLRSLLLPLSLLIPSFALAQVQDQHAISINFEGGQANPDLMGPGTAKVHCPAGLFEAPHWNNFADWSGNDLGLTDNFGIEGDATLTYAVQNNWAATNTAPGDAGNGDMMSGQLDNLQNSDGGGIPNFITVSGLGLEFTAGGYDVYIYQNADSGGEPAGFTIDGVTRYLLQVGGAGTNYPLADAGNVNGFVTSTATDPLLATSSNVVVFENLTADTFTITGAAGAGGARPRPNGIQIISRGGIGDDDSDGLAASFEAEYGLDDDDDGSTNVNNGPAGDPDLDTISNLDEQQQGTAPDNKDTDGDGLDDNVETKNGTFTNETDTGTFPTIADSDGDGLNDGAEVNGDPFDSDPNNPDTDGDTINDADEVAANPFVTNPRSEDTDGDDFTDPVELAAGTDPTDPDSFPQASSNPSIAINFTSDRENAAEILPEETAGIVEFAQGNWNNIINIPAGGDGISGDQTGITSPNAGVITQSDGATLNDVTVSWSSVNAWNTNNGTTNPDNKLMNGYIDNNGNNPDLVQIDVGNLPASYTAAGYTVIVYFGSDGNARTGTIGVEGSDTFSFSTFSNQAGNFPGSYVQTTDTGAGNPNSNYARWDDLTSDPLQIRLVRGSNNNGIHGIQIISSGPATPLEITNYVYDEENNMVTLTWNSIPGATYAIDSTEDLQDWPSDVNDSIVATEDTHTETFQGPTGGETRIFYRVRLVDDN